MRACWPVHLFDETLERKFPMISEELKMFKCGFCSLIFENKLKWKTHVKNFHQEEVQQQEIVQEKTFPCKYCDKEFGHISNRIKHIRAVHLGVKYKCEICNKKYSSSQGLTSHIKADHEDLKFTCDQCPKSYNVKSHLNRHKIDCHR